MADFEQYWFKIILIHLFLLLNSRWLKSNDIFSHQQNYTNTQTLQDRHKGGTKSLRKPWQSGDPSLLSWINYLNFNTMLLIPTETKGLSTNIERVLNFYEIFLQNAT